MSPRTLRMLTAAGIVVLLAVAARSLGAFDWVGHLPGDVRADRDGIHVEVPFTSLVVLAFLLAIVLQLVLRWALRGPREP